MEKDILKISIIASNKESLTQLLKEKGDQFDVPRAAMTLLPDGQISVDAFVSPSALDSRALFYPGIQIRVLADARSRGIERQQKDVKPDVNRFAKPGNLPSGPGIKE